MLEKIHTPKNNNISFQQIATMRSLPYGKFKQDLDTFQSSGACNKISFSGLFSKNKGNISFNELIVNAYLKDPTINNLKSLINTSTVQYAVSNYMLAKSGFEGSNFLIKPLIKDKFHKYEKIFNDLSQATIENNQNFSEKEQQIIKEGIVEAALKAMERNPFELNDEGKRDTYYLIAMDLCNKYIENSLDRLNATIQAAKSNTYSDKPRIEAIKNIVPSFKAFIDDNNLVEMDKNKLLNLFLSTMIIIGKPCQYEYNTKLKEETTAAKVEFKELLENNPKIPENIKNELTKIVKDTKKTYTENLWEGIVYTKIPENNTYNFRAYRDKDTARTAIADFDANPNIKDPDDKPLRDPGFADSDYADYVLNTDIGKKIQELGYDKEKLTGIFSMNPNPMFYDHEHLTHSGRCHPRDLEVAGLSIMLLEKITNSPVDTKLSDYAKEISRTRCPEGYESDPNNFLIKEFNIIPPAKIAKESKLSQADNDWLKSLPDSLLAKVRNVPPNEITKIREWEGKHQESYFDKNNADQERIRKWGNMD